MARAAFNKKTTPFTSSLDLRLKEEQCYIWSIVLYCAEICKLQNVDQEYLESSEMWCWRRLEMISWTDCVKNEVVLQCPGGNGCPTNNKKKDG
jgi:hypothetical protein